MILYMLILFSSLVLTKCVVQQEEDTRILTTSGDTTIEEFGTAFMSVTADPAHSWKVCKWTRSDGQECVFEYDAGFMFPCADASFGPANVTQRCDPGLTKATFFGEYEGIKPKPDHNQNLVCGIKLEGVSSESDTTWTAHVQECERHGVDERYGCCTEHPYINSATVRLFVYQNPTKMSLTSPTIENRNVFPGSNHLVTCEVGGVTPDSVLTWMLGNTEFTGDLYLPVVTPNPDGPGLKVQQTANLTVSDSVDTVDFTCSSTVRNSSKSEEELFTNEETISLKIGCPLPQPLNLSSPAWGCNGTISDAKVGNHVSCNYRCGQGGISNMTQCKGIGWLPVMECDYDNPDVFNFFDAEDQDSFTNPPEDSFFDPSSMLFTSPQDGVYLFGITAASNDVQLQTQTGLLANMHSDSGNSSSIAITLLKQEDTIQAIYENSDRLGFLGTSLHSLGGAGSVHSISGTASGYLNETDAPQNIIMTEHSTNGEHLTYNESSGCIHVMKEGNYLMGLTLSSKGLSYASLKVDDTTLGLGDDTQGQGMMSNSAIMHLNKGACILPQLEPLSQIYEGDKWSQLFLTSIPDGGSGDAFCYGLSQPLFNEVSKQVSFDVPLLPNSPLNSGVFSIPDEEFNPRRFYLVLVNAFMASGTLTIELGDKKGNWEAVGEGNADTTDRRMVSVRKIVEMDNFNNRIRVNASGLLDEGDSHFATFCGMRIGKNL